MTNPEGPIYVATAFPVRIDDGKNVYNLVYFPDKNNQQLQREGQSPHYYYLPHDIRIAKDMSTGDYKFHLLHFEGVRSGDTNVGVTGTQEIAGGLLTLSATCAIPGEVLLAAHDQFLGNWRGNDDAFFGWRNGVQPKFGPVPIRSNMVSISNISPTQNRSVPTMEDSGTAGRGPGSRNRPPVITTSTRPRIAPSPRSIPVQMAFRDGGNLDLWYANLTGQGPGAIDLQAENALAGLLGSMPTLLLWSSFHGAEGGIVMSQALQIPMWTPSGHLSIHGHWDRIFEHFSAAGHYGGFFWSADIQAEFNNLVINGDIQVDLSIDDTLPGSDKIREMLQKQSDLVYQSFLDEAKKVIFDPAPPNVQPAQASGGFLGLGGGFALKARVDSQSLDLKFEETLNTRYLQTDVISSPLTGFYEEIKKDPNAEKKYFTTAYVGDWERKVARFVKPVVNWPDPSKKWFGEPVAFLSAQIGYPNTAGEIQWVGHVFQSTDAPDTTWPPAMEMKAAADVVNPPAGWTPDKTFIKRQVHFTEPPDETLYPFSRVFIEKNIVDLDPGDNGTLTNDTTIEVRADSAGKLDVGPISLNIDLDNAKQEVEVAFQCEGKTADGQDRPITKFLWKYEDQGEDRYWAIYTGQLDFVPRYKYQVRVIVKGSLFTKGMEWTGPWVEAAGNGPLIVTVPQSDDPGVQSRSLIPGAAPMAATPAHPMPPPPITGVTAPASGGAARRPTGPPPTTRTTPPATAVTSTRPPSTRRGMPAEANGENGAGDEGLVLVPWSATPPTTAERSQPMVGTRADRSMEESGAYKGTDVSGYRLKG